MQDTVMRELDEAAPPAFVNGDASHRPAAPARAAAGAQACGRAAAPRSPAAAAPAEEALPFAWPDRLGAVLQLHDDWRQRMALLAQEQLSFMAETGGELLAAGQALAAEPDPARRLELVWTQAMRQMERSLTVSSRCSSSWPAPAAPRRPGRRAAGRVDGAAVARPKRRARPGRQGRARMTIAIEDFLKVDIRVGTIVEAAPNEGARKPAYRLLVDFGPELGRRKSSAQLVANYRAEDLVGRQVAAVVNFPPRQIAKACRRCWSWAFPTLPARSCWWPSSGRCRMAAGSTERP